MQLIKHYLWKRWTFERFVRKCSDSHLETMANALETILTKDIDFNEGAISEDLKDIISEEMRRRDIGDIYLEDK